MLCLPVLTFLAREVLRGAAELSDSASFLLAFATLYGNHLTYHCTLSRTCSQ